MPDLKQALRDFVATSNSGKYATEQELLSKFPELKGYSTQSLKDFVATSNSGKYTTEDELFSKFPEFNQGAPAKKKFALESSSATGSSGSQEPPKRKEVKKPTTEEFEAQFKQAMDKQDAIPKDVAGQPIIKPQIDKKLKTTFETISKNKKEKEIEKKKYSDIFDKQLNIKPNVEDSQYLKDRLDAVNANLIDKEEEYVVPELQYQFGDLGFKFEESGIGDNVKVTAPNGKVSEISLDNLFSSKSKKQSTVLQDFIKDNTPAKGLFVLEKTMKEEDKKFNSQKQVDDSIKVISNELNNLNTKQKQFLVKKNQLEKQINTSGLTEQLKQQKLALNEEMKTLLSEEDNIKQKGKKLDTAVGKYSIAKSKQGTWLGGIWNAINEGASSIAAGTVSTLGDIAVEVAPTGFGMLEKDLKDISVDISKKIGVKAPSANQTIDQWKKTLTEDQLDNWEDEVDDYIKKDFKGDIIPAIRVGNREIFGDVETTKQWSNLKEKDFWGGAILGVAKSLPAIIGGTGVVGAAQRTAQMYAQVSDGLSQEMENDPDFKDISENEKLAITLPIGIVGAVLENLGLRNIKGSQGLINNIALRALGKAGKGVTAKTFRELVENEVESAIARGALTITAAGAAEFETGAAQALTETKFKDFYNYIKGEKMFDTPDSTADLIENVVVSGAQEAVGGFVLGVPTAVSVAFTEKGFLKMDDNTFDTFANMANDENMQSAYVTSLKNQITQGIVTTSEAKDQLNNYRNAAGLYRQLPEGLNTQQKKEAMNLLKEKRDLQNYVEGKDSALVVKQKERITEIDNSLTKLSETDAVQEQSTTEVPVQSETITSETMETGVPESGPEVVTEQVTQEEVTAPQTIIEEQPDVVKVKKSDDFMNDAEQVVSLNGEEAGRMYYDRSSKAWRDPNFDKSKYSPESFERIYGDILGDTKQEATDELIRRKKESMKQEAPIEETITEEIVAEEPQEVQFSKDTILNNFLNKLNSLNPLQKNPIDNKSFVYGDKASLEFNRFDKGDKNEVSLEGITSLDKGKGLGKEAMTDITKSADELGTTLTLDAKPFGKEGLGKKELIDFYKKNGFKVDKQYLEDLDFGSEQEAIDYVLENESEGLPMVREPKISEPQVVSEVNDLLELDTKDQTSLKRVLDYLDSLDSSLDLDPNELNDVTRVMAISTAKAVVKTLKALVKAGITLQEAIKTASEIHSVADKDVLKAFDVIKQGGRQKSAPSASTSDIYTGDGRIISIVKDVTKITMREKDLLVKQIKDKAKGAKDAVAAFKLANQELAKEIKELADTGRITAKQAANVLTKFSKVNAFSNKSVSDFVNYMTKVFENAAYADDLKNAKTLRKQLKKLSKSETKNAELKSVASEFVKIDPSMVDNISDYNEIATKLKKAIEGSNLRGGKLNVADTVDINEVSSYVADMIEQQEEKIRQEKIDEIQNILGVDASEFSAEEIEELLKTDAKIDDDKSEIIKAAIKKAFNDYSDIIKEQVRTGIDFFTGEEVTYTDAQEKLIKRFMNMDTNNMDAKESLAAIDSLVNFLVNKSTARMETVVEQYEKGQNAKKIFDKGITSVPLKKYFSPKLGRFLAEQTSNIGLLLEKAFVGFNRSKAVKEAMGYFELVNGSARAVSKSNKIVNDYVKEFYDKKANGEKFNTLYNSVERGMTAFMIRNIIGSNSKTQAEFKRRKDLLKESADYLLEYGNEQEKQQGAEYQKAYDKILKDSNNAEEVMSKVDKQNLEAVNWWINEWSSKFDSLSDLALNVYNTVLGRGVNYTPDKYKKFSFDESIEDLSNNESAFVSNTDGSTYKKESSGLMKSNFPGKLPTNDKTKTPRTYIDLSFDKVNANAMYDALVDLETAAPIRGIEAFMNSPYFRKIIKSQEDAKLIRGRINNYIRNTRNKNPFSSDELSSAFKALNKMATLGASQALAGPTQPIKQVIPVIFNTLMNAKGRLDVGATYNSKFMKWFKDSGFATGNRGIESLAEIDSIDKLMEQAAESKGAKIWKFIEKANEKQLKILLSNPDKWIAVSSWKTYYEQSLRKQGKTPDYSNPEINEEAANYAEEMVSRQQNVSDKNMAGNLFTSKDTATNAIVKAFMPFASFRMNQSTRIGSDLRVLQYWNTSTKEDKIIAARSLAGFGVESVMFKAVATAFALILDGIASSIMGVDDEDEEKKRKDAIYKGQATGLITDIFSPLPVFDKPIQGGVSYSLSSIQEAMEIPEEEMVALYGMGKEDFAKGLGMFGISISRASEIYETISLAVTGKYKDNFGKQKEIDEEKREALINLIGPMIVTNATGFASPETSSVVRNSVRYAKKAPKPINKKLLKEKSPDTYERMYGEGSAKYEIEQRKKEIKKRIEERKENR
jgi:hypothetical protein